MGLSLLHTFSLEGIAEGWTAECKLVYNAVKYVELKALRAIDQTKLTDDDAADQLFKFIEDHFVSGTGLDAAGKIIELAKEDINDFPLDVASKLFNEMNGGKLDPKEAPVGPKSDPQPANLETPTTA